jgi:hypothetical protein
MNRVARVLKRIEASCYVEIAISERQFLNVADKNICSRTAAPGEFRETGRGIQPANFGAACLRGCKGQSSAASDIE